MEKRDEILKAAKKIFEEKGYRDTSVRDICRAAHVSVSAVSYYFGSKAELHRALFPDAEAERSYGRRDLIVEAAKKLFSQKGYSNVSTREICKEAGVNSAAISYYFGGKKELYKEILEQPSELLTEFAEKASAEGVAPEEVLKLFREYVARIMKEYSYSFPIFMWEMIHPTQVFYKEEESRFGMVVAVISAALEEGAEAGDFRDDLALTETSAAWVGMVIYYYLLDEIRRRSDNEGKVTEDTYAAAALDVFLNGVKKREKG